MAISNWPSGYDYETPSPFDTPYQPIGDNATPETGFTPTYNEAQLRQMIETYKHSPTVFNETTKDKIRKHAIHYNVPFYEGDFNIVDAMKQLGVGMMEGFTTLGGSLVDHPDNEYEAVVRNVGHLIGFAPGILSKPLALLNFTNAAKAAGGLKSIPMLGADWITKKSKRLISPIVKNATKGRAAASKAASDFVGTGKQMAEGAFHLGTATAISAWQQGIDGMLHSAFGGAVFGAGFAAIGNLFPGQGTGPIKALAGSLFQGLPSTMRGATTPEQVYEYLMGAYFGGHARGWKQTKATKFLQKANKEIYAEGEERNAELWANRDWEKSRHWGELEPSVQEFILKEKTRKGSPFYIESPEERQVAINALIKTLGLPLDKKTGEPTKAAYESLMDLGLPKEVGSGRLARETEKELIELHERELKRHEEIGDLKKALSKASETDKRIYQEDIQRLESELVDISNRRDQLAELKPLEYYDKESKDILIEDRGNDGNDIGMKADKEFTKHSEIIVDKGLKNLWDKKNYSPLKKKTEKLRLTNIIDNVINKPQYRGFGVKVDTKELVKDIKDTIFNLENIKPKIDKNLENNLRQTLITKNFGIPVKFKNIIVTSKGINIKDRGEDGLTMAGNQKNVIEPLKVIEEKFAEISSEKDPLTIIDLVTTYKEGRRVDSTLSDLRRALGENSKEYKSILENIDKNMKDEGYYAFGGRGDNDVIIYMKKHPHLKDSVRLDSLTGALNSYFREKPRAKKRFDEAIERREKWESKKEAEENYYSNIMYDMMMNGFKPKTVLDWKTNLRSLLEGKGYIKNATAWNKRQQIWFTPAWKADKEFVANYFDGYIKRLKKTDKTKFESYDKYLDGIANGFARYIIARDLDPALFKVLPDGTKKRIKKLTTKSKNTENDEHVDGMILVEDVYLDALIKDSGMPESGQSKSFIVNPDGNKGALLGKYMMHSVGPDASKMMREKGLHMIMQESAVKQRGEREITDYDIKNNKLEVRNEDAIYELPIEDVRYNYSVKNSQKMVGLNEDGSPHYHRLPKQLLFSMLQNTHSPFAKSLVEDFYNEVVFKNYEGDKTYNKMVDEYLENPTDKIRLDLIEKNIDKLGVEALLKSVNSQSTELADAAYLKLTKINREFIEERIADGEISPQEAQEINKNLNTFNSAMDRITNAAVEWTAMEKSAGRTGEINPVLMHKWIRPFKFQVIKNYVFNAMSKPKIANSGVARMRGFDKWFQGDSKFKDLETRDDIFYLDNNYRDMPLETHVAGYEKTTLGKFWDAFNTKGSGIYNHIDAKNVLTALTVRVPMDSTSGAQVMEFKGFTGRKGHGILMHSRAMRAEGGADLDGDESHIFFGGRKGGEGNGLKKSWKDAWLKNKEEFYEKDDSIYNNKNKEVEELLTIQDSKRTTGIDPESRDSNIWKYDSTWRRDLSARAVEGRRELGSTSNLTQIIKNAHNSILSLEGGKQTFTISARDRNKKWHQIPLTIKARTNEAELNKARKLASSMIAFTADPLDVAGLRGYSHFFSNLHNAYFEVSVPKKFQKIWDSIPEKSKVWHYKNKDSIVGQLGDMNSALYSKDYANDTSWGAGDVKRLTADIENPDTFGIEGVKNSMLTKIAKLAHNVDLIDSPFNITHRDNLVKMYSEHNSLVERLPELTELLGRKTIEVEESAAALNVLDSGIYRPEQLKKVARDFNKFKTMLTGTRYGKGGKNALSTADLAKLVNSKTIPKRERILKEIVKFAEDILTNDVTDMVSLRKIYKYYNEADIGPRLLATMHEKADFLKRHNYLMRTNEGYRKDYKTEDLSSEEYSNKLIKDYEANQRGIVEEKPTNLLTQTEIDAQIADFKATLPNNRAKKLFDMMVLGSYRRDPYKTNISKVGYSSNSIDNASVVEFIGDYSSVMKKAFVKPPKEEGNKIAESFEEGNMMEKDAPVTEARTLLKDSTTGYEGLHGKANMKALPKETRQVLTELAEHIKFYNNNVGKGLNEIARGMTGKNLNLLTLSDFKIMNNFFREHRGGTLFQKLFGDKRPELKTRYNYLFPATVGRELMKYDIRFLKQRGLFLSKNKKGNFAFEEGDMKIPSNIINKAQQSVDMHLTAAQSLSQRNINELNNELAFIDNIKDGESLRAVAVREIEAEGNISKLLNSSKISKPLRQQWAKMYEDNLRTTVKEVDYNNLRDTVYKVTNKAGKRVDVTGEQIVKDVKTAYKTHFKNMFKLISGERKTVIDKDGNEKIVRPIDDYILKKNGKIQYWDYKTAKPTDVKYDFKRFINDIYLDYQKGLGISTKYGIDGLRKIARSMMFDVAKKKDIPGLRKKMEQIEWTGEMSEGYWPHLFTNRAEAKRATAKAIQSIEKSDLPFKEKKELIKKLIYRNKSLTGDWVNGTENWEMYDKIYDEIKTKQKTEKMSWWDANLTTGSMSSRTNHLAGWSIDASVAESYTRNVVRTYYKQLAQMFSRNIIHDFGEVADKKGWNAEYASDKVNPITGKKTTLKGAWINHLKLYAQDAMENPSIIPEYILEDPAMKIKGTPYAWWSDNNVKKKLNKIAKELGVKEKYGLETFDYNNLRHFSNLEGKFELMALLAHPKSMIYNLFGGTMHSVQSAGAKYVKRSRDYGFLSTINPQWTNKQAINEFVINQGVFPDMIMSELGLNPKLQGKNSKAFLKELGKKLTNTGQMQKESILEIAKKYGMTKAVVDIAAKTMTIPEMALRRDSFMAHYLRAWDQFGGAITQYDHPFLVEMGKKGVKATQFLYSAPYRPAFARTALGKIMTRFQLWSWNAVRFRNDVLREARIRGFKHGTPEFEKFKRTAQIDTLTMALASIFAFSIFDQGLPAPLSYFKDTAEWLFGDENTRNKAFYGTWTTSKTGTMFAPLQIGTPPIARLPLNLLKAQMDDNYQRFFDYQIYSMFPFGRVVRDVAPFAKGNILDNPYRMVEKFTGIPYGDLQRKRRELKEEQAYHPRFPVAG
jgi:hypothetical protein